ncbi:MAG: 16S rRNA (adenine(1518)-N(6)/adenine(1519)-N(6))-dimethyltransferase RsmA [Victivallaceae bacterium]|nr:16S rRNA (adenine(1518)-N(6)/adenine(1519)-N(6))-dimethyltransferase RsmA [Victivallaceae bacterium]
MNKQQLTEALAACGMRPGRGLGQNFLLDNNLLDCIVRSAKVAAGMNILEVGPGFGALTRKMLEAGAHVYSIEFDRRLCEYLRRELGNEPNFHLIEGDACKVDFDSVVPRPFRAVANLPYSISSVFIARLLELKEPPEGCFFMLQKEMAQRLSAVPGCGNYGALSVRAGMLYRLKLVRLVPPEVFFPPPEVESALLEAELLADMPPEKVRQRVDRLARMAFNQRRKKLTNTLGTEFGAERIREVLATIGVNTDARPEALSVKEFIALADALEI